MPLIEELPLAHAPRATHGWAYVPDLPSSALIPAMTVPSRKRKRNDAGTTNATATAKQLKAVQIRLDGLGRENWKEGVSVPIPTRTGAAAEKEGKTGGAGGKKTTTNVRRILNYQRGFAHWLADEEAMSGDGGSGGASGGTGNSSVNVGQIGGNNLTDKKVDGRRKSTAAAATPKQQQQQQRQQQQQQEAPVETGRRGRRRATTTDTTTAVDQTKSKDKRGRGKGQDTSTLDIKTEDAPAAETQPHTEQQQDTTGASTATATATATPTPTQTISLPQAPKPPYDPKLDTNPLLRTLNLPKPPSRRVLDILLSEPPLSYAAARAKPLPDLDTDLDTDTNPNDKEKDKDKDNDKDKAGGMTRQSSMLKAKPARRFCGMCGYWGRVKCRKCGEWTCGIMECWKGHEAVCVSLGMY